MEIKEVLTETPHVSVPGLLSSNKARLQELKLEINAEDEGLKTFKRNFKERKAVIWIAQGRRFQEARELSGGDFVAFLNDPEIGVSERSAYYYMAAAEVAAIEDAKGGDPVATVANAGLKGCEKRLKQLTGENSETAVATVEGTPDEKELHKIDASWGQARKKAQDLCRASTAKETLMRLDEMMARIAQEAGEIRKNLIPFTRCRA